MEQKFGTYIIAGLAIGVIVGGGMGAAAGNPIWGLGLGALFGVFIGWFIAAAVAERQNENRRES